MIQNNEPLAKEIRALGQSRKEICLLTGISYSSLSGWLNGFSTLTPVKKTKLSDAIRVFSDKMTKKAFDLKHNSSIKTGG